MIASSTTRLPTPLRQCRGTLHQVVSRRWLLLILVCLTLQTGCMSLREKAQRRVVALATWGNRELVKVEEIDGGLSRPWQRLFAKPDPPSDRTALLLRKYDLEAVYQKKPDDVIEWLHQLVQNNPTMEEVHALAELAHKQAYWSQQTGDKQRATRLYAAAIIHAYQFLFDDNLNLARNAYDPQFRSICDVYNRSLEGLLREICLHEGFSQGYETTIGTDKRGIELTVRVEGRWRDESFERFELVNNYRTEGFQNQHETYGLGAPLIAIRKKRSMDQQSFEQYYPPELSLPLTAFLHLVPDESHDVSEVHQVSYVSDGVDDQHPRRAVLSLYDPLEKTLVTTGGKVVPLESDITTPLAFALRDPLLNKGVLATASLLDAEFAPEAYGMYMLEPYDPNKVPVVMVHGLWSSPTTWAHMFNDLRANRNIHKNYQFWFYAYPTAQPFWMSAKQMREDLEKIREQLDPQRNTPALDEMILVGHSMGGLISTMQTIDSQDHFWNIVSDRSINELDGTDATKQALESTFYFQPNPSIQRVITIATPFRGSNFANFATRLLGQKLITLPALVTNDFEKFARDNADLINDASFLTTNTSIDSLSPDNPIFEAFLRAPRAPHVIAHNIVGRQESRTWLGTGTGKQDRGDGVVGLKSAQLDQAYSQTFVSAEHSQVHQHPGCVLEVKRILLEILSEKQRANVRTLPPIRRNASIETSETVR